MTLHIVYSIPDLDSRNCDKRIEKQVRIDAPLVDYHWPDLQEVLRLSIDWSEWDLGAEVEFIEYWHNGERFNVVYPIAQGVKSCNVSAKFTTSRVVSAAAALPLPIPSNSARRMANRIS